MTTRETLNTSSWLCTTDCRCIYDPLILLKHFQFRHFEQRHAINFPIIRGVLRLSIKYVVEYLRLECLKMLQHDWPITLEAWDLREREAMCHNGVYESAKIRPHPIFVINLAHELGPAGAALLPAAFYDLSRYNCSHIWMGCPNSVQDVLGGTNKGSTNTARLSMADLQTVMIGKEASQTFIARFLQQKLEERHVIDFCEHGPYQDGRECRNALDDLAHEMYRGVVGVTCGRDSDPLFTLDAAVVMQERGVDGGIGAHPASRACERCRMEFAQTALTARRYVWNELPYWFGLKNMRDTPERFH